MLLQLLVFIAVTQSEQGAAARAYRFINIYEYDSFLIKQFIFIMLQSPFANVIPEVIVQLLK
jgi:hypothetical protein